MYSLSYSCILKLAFDETFQGIIGYVIGYEPE